MKILVIGGTGLIGSKTVSKLRQLGHCVIATSPITGINTIAGEDLAEAMSGAEVMIDLSNSPSEKNLLAAGINIKHHIALSVVGTSRLQHSVYFRAKQEQENLIKKSGIPYTIIHSTQYMEFLGGIAASAHHSGSITLSTAKIQPIAADDVASFVVETAVGKPVNGTIEIAGPDRYRLSDLVKEFLTATKNPIPVIADSGALYFGAQLEDLTLIPENNARLGAISFKQWLPTLSPVAK